MKKLISLFGWISRKWNLFFGFISRRKKDSEAATKFRIEFVEDNPDSISENIIFVVQDGNLPELLAFKCPCGCKAGIILKKKKQSKSVLDCFFLIMPNQHYFLL